MDSDGRKQLWEWRDHIIADVGATPKEKAARGSQRWGVGAEVRPEGLRTQSKAIKLKDLNTVPLSAEDFSRMVE